MTVTDLYHSGFQFQLPTFLIETFKVNSTPWSYFMTFYFFVVAIVTPVVTGKYVYICLKFAPLPFILAAMFLRSLDRQPLEHFQYVFFKWPFGNLYRGEAFNMRAWRSTWWFLCIYVSRIVFGLTLIYQIYSYGSIKIFIDYNK